MPADGVYLAEFDTDSSMFHVNEAKEGKGELTVENGKMILHISLPSKNIVNLYVGKAADAQKAGVKVLLPTVDTVTYKDGFTETVYGYDIPVPALEKEFDLALLGKKGVWYDHKVSVSNPEPASGDAYEGLAKVTLEGGSGKAKVESPARITWKDGKAYATLVWSSDNYDYMKVDGEKYLNESKDGYSTFTIPVSAFGKKLPVIADTTAMSTPHEVEYSLYFEKIK